MFKTVVENRLSELETEKVKIAKEEHILTDLLSIYGTPSNGHSNASKTDQYKHVIRELIQVPKAYHITDFESEFERKGFEFNKGLIHQVLSSLRESGELIAVRINKSNQKYYYLSPKGKQGNGIKDEYLPMDRKYVESLELM